MNFHDAVIDFVRQHARGPVLEVCCGSGWLLEGLEGSKNIGVDPLAPNQKRYRRQQFSEFLCDEPDVHAAAGTIVMCYPPGPAMIYTVGREVVDALLPHQRLILVSPRPYENATVAGSYRMWLAIFSKTIVEVTSAINADVCYVLSPGDGIAAGTKQKILNGHGLWQYGGQQYDEYGNVIIQDAS